MLYLYAKDGKAYAKVFKDKDIIRDHFDWYYMRLLGYIVVSPDDCKIQLDILHKSNAFIEDKGGNWLFDFTDDVAAFRTFYEKTVIPGDLRIRETFYQHIDNLINYDDLAEKDEAELAFIQDIALKALSEKHINAIKVEYNRRYEERRAKERDARIKAYLAAPHCDANDNLDGSYIQCWVCPKNGKCDCYEYKSKKQREDGTSLSPKNWKIPKFLLRR